MLVQCKQCNKPVDKQQRDLARAKNVFCSHSCSSTYYNSNPTDKIKEKWAKLKKDSKDHACSYCKSAFKLIRGRKKLFCSTKCKRRFMFENGKYSSNSAEPLKQHIIEDRGYKCEICGISTWMNKPLTLILDHINGDSSNNFPNNLRLVCSNCDSQLPTYKAKNNGNGRHKRKQRYQDGKSH